MGSNGAPKIAVIIPTYNRSAHLRQTLESLTRQSLPATEFDVIVADDGSSDDTEAVARSFADDLRLQYFFQEDRGFRAATARNGGARRTSAPVLVFLDTGALAGPDFLRAHLDAHATAPTNTAVIGYAYAYRPWDEFPGLAEALAEMPPEQVVERYRDDPEFWDWRHEELETVDFDPNRRAVPWLFFFGINVSIRADVFWSVGGFYEEFRYWGTEDLELAFRLNKHRIPFTVSREAWVLEGPHDRDMETNVQANKMNAPVFLDRHPEPATELAWWIFMDECMWSLEPEYAAVLKWTDEARDISVRDEIARATEDLSGRIVIVGCGADLPPSLPPSTLVDFDRTLLDRALADGRHTGHHAIGIRTPLPDQSVDHVVITSRLGGLWGRWRADLLVEARRIGAYVHTPEL